MHQYQSTDQVPLLKNNQSEVIEIVDDVTPRRIVPPKNLQNPRNPMIQLQMQRQQQQQQQQFNQNSLLDQPKVKSYAVSTLPGLSDEFVVEKVAEIKKITFSTEKREMIKQICQTNSLTCQQARLFTDLFRASYEKKLLIIDDFQLSDPKENMKHLLDTFDFEEDKKLTHFKLLK
eukprot:gene3355-5902_t